MTGNFYTASKSLICFKQFRPTEGLLGIWNIYIPVWKESLVLNTVMFINWKNGELPTTCV